MKNRKSTFFTSDWHIGHENSLVFDNRPFRDLDQMHRVLVNNYNAQVPKDGICYFLGDIGVSSSEICLKIMNQLNGTKVLILGNHDKKMNAMYGCGFDVVLNAATIYIANERVTMTHCPLRGLFREDVEGMQGVNEYQNWHKEHIHTDFSIVDEGQFHLHGHIHSPNKGRSQKILGKQYDVGVPGNKYRPVSISEIESWIAQYKKANPDETGT